MQNKKIIKEITKNGCPNAGGKIFLIDAEGIIVAVNPTPEQVEEYLKENL